MTFHLLLSLLFVVLVTAAWIGDRGSGRVAAGLNRIARVLFGRFISPNSTRERRIEAAFIDTTYRTYAAKTLLFALLGLVAGAVAGAYLLAGVLLVLEPIVRTLSGLPRTMTRPLGIHPDFTLVLTSRTRWVILLGGGAIIGLLVGFLSYVFRWQLPANTAEVRRRSIEEGLPRTAAFMYALSRGGMEFPQILRILGRNRDVYGEAAREMSVAVREMDLFGRDMITALRRMGKRTPSDQFKTFAENLTSVLSSGSNLPGFLSEQYERFRKEAEERQNEVLELLATIAEAYVTVLVAGMLFLITILLVFGLTTTDTLWALQLLIYVMIPLANVGFAVYLQQKLDALGIARRSGGEVLDRMTAATPVYSAPPTDTRRADGGLAADRDNRRMMALYDRVGRLKGLLRSPLRAFLWNPAKLLWLTIPIAALVVVLRAPAAFQADGVAVRTLDGYLVQSLLFVLVTYAVIRELYKRRVDRIEAATPELLERLASLNEAGMSVVEGLDRVREGDLGPLTPEVERVWRDIEYGANVDDALIRFGRRVRTTAVTRVVTLLTNAMRASGDMGPVLRIASKQARAEVKLRRRRRRQMFTYLVVIYVSFFVFLVIIAAVSEVLVPALPETVPTPEGDEVTRVGASPDAFSRFGDVNQAAYRLVFFHAALLQAVFAGFIAGQLGEGSLRDGAKHAAITLTIAYLAVVLLSSPVASVSAEFAVTDGDRISNVDSVDLSEGGFVAVYDDSDGEGVDGRLLGYTGYLPPGTHNNLTIPLQNAELTEDTDIRIVVHHDTDGDERFGFTPPYRTGAGGVDRPYEPLSDGAAPGVSMTVEYLGN
jgi:flagellar protein FlaJ